jgi:hypothetical protein
VVLLTLKKVELTEFLLDSMPMHSPSLGSHMRTVLSMLHETTLVPSCDHEHASTYITHTIQSTHQSVQINVMLMGCRDMSNFELKQSIGGVARTQSSWPNKVTTHSPMIVSQIHKVLSSLHETISAPSGDQEHPNT